MGAPPGLDRVAKLLGFARDSLMVSTQISIPIEGAADSITGKLVMHNASWSEASIVVMTPSGERKFHISGFPVGPFASALSILNPLLHRLRVMLAEEGCRVRSALQDALAELQAATDVLTTRLRLCQDDLEPDWRRAIQPTPIEGAYLSVFPFRDSIEVTYLEAVATAKPPTPGVRLDVKAGDVVTIGGRPQEVAFYASTRMRQGWLSQALMWIEEAAGILGNIGPILRSKPGKGTT